MKEDITRALKLIDQAQTIVLVSHDRPDGDAIGSLVGAGLMLEAAGKTVTMLNNDGVPATLDFLPCSDRVTEAQEGANFPADLIISLDSAGIDRISKRVWQSLPGDVPVINVDHHVSNTKFGDVNVIDDCSPATGEIVFDIASLAGWKITPEVAENLFAAISTDTGSFCYPNTTAKTFRVGAGLIEAGVNVGRINQQLYESFPLRRVECIRDLLQDMKISFGGKCASVRLTADIKRQLGLGPGDTEGVIDIIRAIDTVVVAVFFEELDGGKIRVSSRSKDRSADVGKICESFGGGGHTLAAGTRMQGPIENAESRFLEAVGKVL